MKIINSYYSKVLVGASLVFGLAVFTYQKDKSSSEIAETQLTKLQISSEQSQISTVDHEHEVVDVENNLNSEEEENPFSGKEVKLQFQQIAKQYEEEIQYPNFSRPIKDEYDLIQYMPNRSVLSSRPINLDDIDGELDEDGPRIALKTSQFNYYPGDSVSAEAFISGLSEASSVNVTATIRNGKEVLAKATQVNRLDNVSDPTKRAFSIQFSDLNGQSVNSHGDMQVVAEFKISGQSYFITSLIRYPVTVARLDKVGDAYVENEYLMIPVYISTSSPGLHSIKANLYDVENNTPLIHLNAVERLTEKSGTIFLKAHIAALKKVGNEGPYEIRDVSLTRGASAPNFTIEQGLVESNAYPVSSFSFSEYEDVAYQDERAMARLEFLNKLGRID